MRSGRPTAIWTELEGAPVNPASRNRARVSTSANMIVTVADPQEIREAPGALALSAEPVDRVPPSLTSLDANPAADVCA